MGKHSTFPLPHRCGQCSTAFRAFTDSPFVFGKALKSWDKAKAKIDAATGIVDWQFRDIRRTVSTGMQRLGISEDVIDAVQAHAKAGIKRVYQRHKYAAEKLEALQAWGDWISVLPAHPAL